MEYFGTMITDEKYSGLNPVQFGYENCKPLHSYGPAIRDIWLIHFVVSGCGYFKIRNKEYIVHAGEMFVIPPFEEIYYFADSEKPWSYIWIGFTSGEKLPLELEDIIRCPEALNIFNDMKRCDRIDNGRSAFLCARLWDLFALLMSRKDMVPDYVEMALSCIHSEYMNNITVESISERLNLDRSYFYTIFKKKVGISPKQYLMNYRMNIAASLVLDRGKSVSVAAHSVGYNDIYNFSKMFKRYFGVSPMNYVKFNSKNVNSKREM